MIKKICNSIKKNGLIGTSIIYITKIVDSMFLWLFRKLPIKKNYIVLESEGDYTDNIRVFYEYLIENGYNKKYRLIWIVHEPKKYKKEENVVFISRFNKIVNFKADYYVAVSKYFIFSHPYWLENWRKEQIVIGTTHSVSQLKESEVGGKKIVDYILACSEEVKERRKVHFGLDDEHVLVIGMPRIDLLYKHQECISRILPNYRNEKIFLVMETFKQAKGWTDSCSANPFALNVIHRLEELKKLDHTLKKYNAKMIIKIHHLQDMSYLKTVQLDNIIYITDENLQHYDIQVNELLENADVLLTDYSSVFYEFLLFNRPIGFLVGDINDYSRGFILKNPFDEMPGEKIYDINGLLNFIENPFVLNQKYEVDRNIIKNKVFCYFDSNNCERLYNWIDEH